MRALEHFTRVLFLGGDDDRCVQFLYADLSSETLGTAPFASHLSEEDLNGLLCGEIKYRVPLAAGRGPSTRPAVGFFLKRIFLQ